MFANGLLKMQAERASVARMQATLSTGPGAAPGPLRRRPLDVVLAAAVALAAAVVLAAAAAPVLGDARLVARTLAYALAGACVVVFYAARHLGAAGFGYANRVTLVRGALTAFVLALIGAPAASAETAAWIALAVALTALALDHVDGRLARARRETSAFGARFDMETDALLMLGASLLAWRFDKAGAWVLAAGALRYVFVAGGWLAPWLKRPLPGSRRRQTACVVQTAALLVALAPVVAAPWSAAVAAAGLAALVASFGIDVRWLARARHDTAREAAAP